MTTPAEQLRADLDVLEDQARTNRIGRTSVQAGIPAAVVTIVEWICALQGWDLDPWSDGTGLPTVVAVAFAAVGTGLAAWFMNRRPKPPADS